MANPLIPMRKREKIKVGGGGGGTNMLLAYMLSQEKGQAGQSQMGEGSIPTKQTDPSTGITWENPEGASMMTADALNQRKKISANGVSSRFDGTISHETSFWNS